MAKHLQNELDQLKKKLLSISALVEEGVAKAVLSVSKRESKVARAVMEEDQSIDLREVELEEDCLKVLALHQPVAADLRFLVAVLKINNDLERIGDLAVNIAERSIYLNQFPAIEAPFDFETMAKKTRSMLNRALTSLIEQDSTLARQVSVDDSEVDAIHRQMYRTVEKKLRENPDQIEALIQYLSVSRSLERIADYATNIAEDVIYMREGLIVRHRSEELEADEVSDSDGPSNIARLRRRGD